MKKLIAVFLMLVMVLSMASCGTKNALPTKPADIVKKAEENTNKAKSMELTGTINYDVTVSGQTYAGKLDMNMAMFLEPFKVKMDMNLDMGAELGGSQAISVYMIQEGDKYYTYTSAMGTWAKQELTDTKIIDSLKSAGKTSVLSESADKFTKVDSNDEVTTLEYVLTADDAKKAVEASGALTELSGYGVDASLFESMKDTKITMTVDNKTVTWKNVSVDLKETLQGVVDSLLSSMGALLGGDVQVTINTCNADIEYKNFDKAAEFELPEEAKNAQEISGLGDVTMPQGDIGESTAEPAEGTEEGATEPEETPEAITE